MRLMWRPLVALATQEYNYEFILTLSGGNVWPVLDSVFNVSENGQASYSGDTVTVALDGNSISLTILPAAGDVGTGGGIAAVEWSVVVRQDVFGGAVGGGLLGGCLARSACWRALAGPND